MIVADASVVFPALIGAGPLADSCRARLAGEELAAPEILDLEVVSALRRLHLAGQVSTRRANATVKDLVALPLVRAAHRLLLGRVWELRGNLVPYDAAYVALAELLEVPLVTADGRLARAAGPRCRFELLT